MAPSGRKYVLCKDGDRGGEYRQLGVPSIPCQALDEANKRIEELENKLLANVPVDTAKEIKNYQEKIVSQHLKCSPWNKIRNILTITSKLNILGIFLYSVVISYRFYAISFIHRPPCKKKKKA